MDDLEGASVHQAKVETDVDHDRAAAGTDAPDPETCAFADDVVIELGQRPQDHEVAGGHRLLHLRDPAAGQPLFDHLELGQGNAQVVALNEAGLAAAPERAHYHFRHTLGEHRAFGEGVHLAGLVGDFADRDRRQTAAWIAGQLLQAAGVGVVLLVTGKL